MKSTLKASILTVVTLLEQIVAEKNFKYCFLE